MDLRVSLGISLILFLCPGIGPFVAGMNKNAVPNHTIIRMSILSPLFLAAIRAINAIQAGRAASSMFLIVGDNLWTGVLGHPAPVREGLLIAVITDKFAYQSGGVHSENHDHLIL